MGEHMIGPVDNPMVVPTRAQVVPFATNMLSPDKMTLSLSSSDG